MSVSIVSIYLLLVFSLNRAHGAPIMLQENLVSKVESASQELNIFCFDGNSNQFDVTSTFLESTITISAMEHDEFGWHDVKGLSDDDFHSHLEKTIYHILTSPEERSKNQNSVGNDANEFRGFFRDILSACPTPFSYDRKQCAMKFSPFGRSCVSIQPSRGLSYAVVASSSFNPARIFQLLVGVSLLLFSNSLSKSKIFHYSSGCSLFMVGGLLLLLLFLSRRLFKRNSGTSFVTFMLSGSYATGALWFLKNNLKSLILTNWEYVLGYIVFTGLCGCIATSIARSYDGTKRMIRTSAKWVLRITSALIIYNSFASPLISLLSTITLIALYIFYAVMKNLSGKKRD